MNKKTIMIGAIAAAYLLGGCSSSVSKKTLEGQDVVVSFVDGQLTAKDAFERNLTSASTGKLVYPLVEKMVVTQEIPITPSMRESAKLRADNYLLSIEDTRQKNGDAKAEETKNSAIQYLQLLGFNRGLDDLADFFVYQMQLTEYQTRLVFSDAEQLLNIGVTKARRVRHILVKVADPNNITAEEQTKIDLVKQELASGKDFATIASESSDDTASGQNGGDLGVIDVNSPMVPEFLNAAMSLEKGVVSEPVLSQYGYHWIEVTATSIHDLTNASNEAATVAYVMEAHPELVPNAIRNSGVEFANDTIKKQFNDYIDGVNGGNK